MITRKLPAMRVRTAAEVAASARSRYLAKDNADPNRVIPTPSGSMKRSEAQAIVVGREATVDALKDIMHPSWLYPVCTACNEYATAVVDAGESGYRDHETTICLTCAEAFVSLLKQFPGAADKID